MVQSLAESPQIWRCRSDGDNGDECTRATGGLQHVESARRRQTLLRSLRLDFLGLLQLAPGVAPKRGVGAAAGSRAGEGPTVVPRRGEGGQARAAARRVGFAAQRQVSAGPPRARTVVGAPVLMTPLVECHGCGGGDPPPRPAELTDSQLSAPLRLVFVRQRHRHSHEGRAPPVDRGVIPPRSCVRGGLVSHALAGGGHGHVFDRPTGVVPAAPL